MPCRFASSIYDTATPGLDTPPLVHPVHLSTCQIPSTDFSFNWEKSLIVIRPWTSLATTTAAGLSVSFIIEGIDFAPLVAIFLLCNYALNLVIQLIHFLMALELETLMFHPNDLNLG